MRLGLISDVHGNRIALDAVVADGNAFGVDAWWVLGDLVAIGPEPVETLAAFARTSPGWHSCGATPTGTWCRVRGPAPHAAEVGRDPDVAAAFMAIEASFAWTRDELGTADLAWLGALPARQRTALRDGTRILGVHASPRSDDGAGITPAVSDRDLGALLAPADADVVCGGHTHQPTDRRLGATRAINLGSVSNPITSDLRASYVVVDDDPHGHRVRHRRVRYDHDAVVTRIRRGPAIPRRTTSRASSAATRSVIARFDPAHLPMTTEQKGAGPCRTGPSKSPRSRPRWEPSGW